MTLWVVAGIAVVYIIALITILIFMSGATSKPNQR